MLRQKLTSQSGASITYALLLFLVCAVVGSVVLAAGTAAAGRMSRAVDSDQRYYSVTSAASLIKQELDGHSNTVVYTVGADDTLSFYSFDGNTAWKPINGIMDCASAAVAEGVPLTTGFPMSLNLSAKKKGSSDSESGLSVSISAKINAYHDLLMDISNAEGEQPYILRIIFSPSIDTIDSKKKTKDSEGHITITKTETKKITWNFTKITSDLTEGND